MKQLKFLKTVSCDGKPIWYAGCSYEVSAEGANSQGRDLYKLFCEDLHMRGIDKVLQDDYYKVIEIEDKKEVEVKKETETEISEEKSEKKTKSKASTTKKKSINKK